MQSGLTCAKELVAVESSRNAEIAGFIEYSKLNLTSFPFGIENRQFESRNETLMQLEPRGPSTDRWVAPRFSRYRCNGALTNQRNHDRPFST
jgi:hypothetical protein